MKGVQVGDGRHLQVVAVEGSLHTQNSSYITLSENSLKD